MNKFLIIGIVLVLIIFSIIAIDRYKFYKKCQEDSSNGFTQDGVPIKCRYSLNKNKIAFI